MNWWLWAGVALLAYWLVAAELDRRGVFPDWVSVSGPLTTLHTQRGRDLLDRLAQRRRFWRAWSNLGIGIALVVMLGAFLLFVLTALLTLQNPEPTAVNQPRNALAIPGVNDFIPAAVTPYVIFALVVGLVVHEGGHGLLCRVEDIEIDSLGLALLAVIPMGAFVEPDEESQVKASRGGRTRMFAAGVTNNFALAAICFALLFGPVAGAITVASGAPVAGALPGSPADEAGLDYSDRIVGANGQQVEDADALDAVLANTSERNVTLRVAGEGEVEIRRTVFVTGAAPAAPVDAGSVITAVDGQRVDTVAAYRSAVRDSGLRANVTVQTGQNATNATTSTILVGTRVTALSGGALAAQTDLGAGSQVVLTSVAGERVREPDDLAAVIAPFSPGETVELVGYRGGERVTYQVTLGGEGENALVGINYYAGFEGVTVDDFGLEYYPADNYLAILGGEPGGGTPLPDSLLGSPLAKAFYVIMLPLAGIAGAGTAFPFNFPGFVDQHAAFFDVVGPLAPYEGAVFALANALFWTAWLNFNLGFFNCIPAFPLDGGHILRTSTESIVSRLPIDASYSATKAVTVSIGLAMGLSLFAVIFVPQIAG